MRIGKNTRILDVVWETALDFALGAGLGFSYRRAQRVRARLKLEDSNTRATRRILSPARVRGWFIRSS